MLTYLFDEGDTVGIYLQRPTGVPVALVTGMDDAAVLDFTGAGGGIFALLTVEDGEESITLVRADGLPVQGGINAGWASVVDADWSPDGQRLIVEAISDGDTVYVFLSADGTILSEPELEGSNALREVI
jgi:hypothetical protein